MQAILYVGVLVVVFVQTEAKCSYDKGLVDNLMDMACEGRNKWTNHNKPGKRTPAFTASKTSTNNIGPNQVIKFDKVWLNYKHAYNPKTGVFTVPESGLYVVAGSVMSNSGKHLHCHLWKNNESNVGVFGTNYSQGALHAVMQLKKGDRVYVKHDNANESIYGSHWSMFSAYKISDY